MRVKHTIIIIVLAYCLDFFGAAQKIMHHPHADSILMIAALLKVTGSLLFVYKLLTYPKVKDFINW
jgi:hypothetical protein